MGANNKIDLNYLVFDDDTEAKNIYSSKIIIPGFNCNLVYINPVDFYNVDDNVFDSTSFVQCITDKTKGLNVNLIITDWNILGKSEQFNGFVGWDVIENVLNAKDKLKSRTFLIYSADLTKASEYIIDKIKSEISTDENQNLSISKEFISKILELRLKFCKRDDNRFTEIITLLKGTNTISNIVLDTILSFDKNTVINTGNEFYDGKKIEDLVKDSNPDNGGLKFIREFIELSIANYTELNDN